MYMIFISLTQASLCLSLPPSFHLFLSLSLSLSLSLFLSSIEYHTTGTALEDVGDAAIYIIPLYHCNCNVEDIIAYDSSVQIT